MATDMTVANTILEQLGGRRFIMMTGAKKFIGTANSLIFRVPGRTSDGCNKVVVTLTAMDDYTIETFFIRAPQTHRACSTRDGVYCDNLQAVFSSITGLAVSL